MFKYVICAFLIGAVIGVAAGGIHLHRAAAKNRKEMDGYAGKKIEVKKNFGKVLVVYYSLSGNTRAVAEKIKAKTGADIYGIGTEEEFSAGPLLYAKTRSQVKSGKYPALKGELPDPGNYDLVFVGSPVWWYTVSTPVLSFLEKVDFKGKKVVPFSTQGSNPGTFFEDFGAKAKNAKLLPGAQFNNIPEKYRDAEDNKISAWLNGLEL